MDATFHVRVTGARLKMRGDTRRLVRRLGAETLLLALTALLELGCSSRPERTGEPLKPGPAGASMVEGIEYRGELLVMESFPVQLAASVMVTNASGEWQRLEFPDGCIVLMRAYQGNERVWDQASSAVCTMAIETLTFEPGESRTFRSSTNAYDVLGGNLPDGTYRLTAYLRPEGRVVEVELGSTELAIPRK